MTYAVREFFGQALVAGQFPFPADKITRVSAGGTLQLDSRTNGVAISSAAGGNVSFNEDGQITTDDIQVLSAVPNQFLISNRPGGVKLLFT